MQDIRLDTSTLPQDGQKVKWLAVKDEGTGNWKKGEYIAKGEMFVVDDPEDDFDTAWQVLQWEPIK